MIKASRGILVFVLCSELLLRCSALSWASPELGVAYVKREVVKNVWVCKLKKRKERR